MNLAGIEISYLLRDLAAKNSGYYLSNIYGITRDCLLFKLRHPEKEELALMFSTIWTVASSEDMDNQISELTLMLFQNSSHRRKQITTQIKNGSIKN